MEWTDRLSPENLSTVPRQGSGSDGGTPFIASDLETYCMFPTDASSQARKYDQYIEVCNEAFHRIKKFYYDNDSWFQRRIARCHAGRGNSDIALESLLSLLPKRREWFIQKVIAALYLQKKKQMMDSVTSSVAH